MNRELAPILEVSVTHAEDQYVQESIREAWYLLRAPSDWYVASPWSRV
jgi:hypothetical protein